MTQGSVAPCTSSVPTATRNAIAWISGRPGNGEPSGSVAGIAAAAASVTTPRMPVHEITAPSCHESGSGGTIGALPWATRRALRRWSHAGPAAAAPTRRPAPTRAKMSSGRMAMTAASTTSPPRNTDHTDAPASCRSSITNRSCRPT